MQEQVNERSVALVIKSGKITGTVLAKALLKLCQKLKNPQETVGKQSVKKLVRKGAKLQNIEINDSNIKSFERTARKYGIDFALKKDISSEKPKYIVFFKAKDIDVMTAAFYDFSNRMLKRTKEKPSILKKMEQFRDKAKGIFTPVKNRDRGGMEL